MTGEWKKKIVLKSLNYIMFICDLIIDCRQNHCFERTQVNVSKFGQ